VVGGSAEVWGDKREVDRAGGKPGPSTTGTNYTDSAYVSANTVLARGATVCAIIDILEMKGYSVELLLDEWISGYANGRSMVWGTQARAKGFEDQLDPSRLAFFLAHPSMLRRVQFAVQEHLPDWEPMGCYSGGGYGYPINPPEHLMPDLYFGNIAGNDAAQLVEDTLEFLDRFNITVSPEARSKIASAAEEAVKGIALT